MAIITAAEYKTYATISSTNKDDRIAQLLEPVSLAVEAYLKYKFTDDTTVFSNPKKTAIFPIHKFQQEYLLEETDVYVTFVQWQIANPYIGQGSSIVEIRDQYQELLDNEWFVDTSMGKITFLRPIMQDYFATVEYKTSKTVSEDIKLAALMLLDYWIDNKNFQQTVSSQGQSVSKVSTRNLPKHIEAILNPHRGL